MRLQVVDYCKKFTDIFVGMSKSMDDACILRNSSFVWWHVPIESKWEKYQTLHSWGQRLPFANLVNDSPQVSCECAPYYTWGILQQAIKLWKECGWKCIWDSKENV